MLMRTDKPYRTKKDRRAARDAERARTNPKRTMSATVSSPTVPGATERVEVVIDTVFWLRCRRRIDEPSWLAAQTYRKAYDTVGARMGGTMDFDRARSGSGANMGYSPVELEAADKLLQADRLLGQIDGDVILLVVGCNWSIEDAAQILFGPDPQRPDRATRKDREQTGERVRIGLRLLAKAWHPGGAKSPIRTWRAEGAVPREAKAGTHDIDVGAVPMRWERSKR